MSLRLRILQIDVPAPDLALTIAFWAQALSADPVDAPGAFTHLVGATSALEVHVQSLEDGRPGYHLDLEVVNSSRDVEVARLIARRGREVAVSADGYTVVADPAGLRHCVIEPGTAVPTPVAERRARYGYLDGVFLDVPVDVVDAEVDWWAAALDAPTRPPPGPEVQAVAAPPRVHVDLSTIDVADEAQRLIELGASHVADVQDWTTLADPVGNLLRVVPA
jgi:hypothetical protein